MKGEILTIPYGNDFNTKKLKNKGFIIKKKVIH